MYLSRLTLNPRSRQVQRELADPYQMHRTVFSGFPAKLPNDERILFRLEQDAAKGLILILVQSQHLPDWSGLTAISKDYLLPIENLPPGWENPAVKQVDLRLKTGQRLAFRLRANPTIKRVVEGKKNGQRVGIYNEPAQLKWLERKLFAAGGRLLSARIAHPDRLNSNLYRNDQKHNLTFCAVQFDGVLEVQDENKLQNAVQNGIGSAKGFGFGLLSLAPLPRPL